MQTDTTTPAGRVDAGSLRKEHVGRKISLSGWVQKRRDFGELIFIDIRERSGMAQVVIDQARALPAVVAAAKELRQEFVIRVEGEVAERIAGQQNPNMPTGEVEVIASSIEILSRSDVPPFVVENETTAAEDTRLRYRYLDLRRPALTANLVLRDRISFGVRDYLHQNGFLEIETPILTRSTPEGARDYLVPSRVHPGNFYALPQSPQIFKQLLMVSGMERYYQIARCFRDEDLRSDRQPEFTQIDIEASFIDEEFLYSLIEGMFARIFPLAGIELTTPFVRMRWQEAMDRFGVDRPDTRFGLELVDISAAAAATDFAPLRAAIESKGTVRAIVVPGGAAFSRKRIDDLTEAAKSSGASGLVWIKTDEQRNSSIRKFLNETSFDSLRTAAGAGDGDLILAVAGKETMVWDVLGNLRLKIARDEKLIPEEKWNFLWVTDFPLLEHDEVAGRYFAKHHPFTSPAVADYDKLESDPGATLARAYDIVLNGLELGGGSIRINTPELQSRMFRALGINEDEAKERFGFLLEAFRYGAPPHGGIALGLDRIVMLMARATSIRDVIAFPKTMRGQDLMCGAPSSVPVSQLDDLAIAIRKSET
jgi:aspartyl-tRNA synthetase